MDNKAVLAGVAALLGLFSVGAHAAGTKFYKCVDKNGNVQYVSVLTADCVDQQHAVPMEGGREAKKQAAPTGPGARQTIQQQTPEEMEQARHDEALLGSFSSEADIDLARDRNLQQVNARISGIQMRMKSAKDDMDAYQKEIDTRKQGGKSTDGTLQELYNLAASKYAKLQDDMTKAQAEALAIRARYEADKQRYHELTTNPKK